MNYTIAAILFDDVTLLDFVGAHDVLARIPNSSVDIISPQGKTIRTDLGIMINTDIDINSAIEKAKEYDLVFIPGGPGQLSLMGHAKLMKFLQLAADQGAKMTSVCTGAMILAAAGILKNKKATTHWLSLPHLEIFGAIPISERIVKDGNIITAAGVSSGIDFALTLAADIAGEEFAQSVQLMLEYDPEPPFSCGSPSKAPQMLVERVSNSLSNLNDKRIETYTKLVST